jgi:excisionase family DNA binding protein
MLLRVQDCCKALNMGRTALYSLFGTGALPSVKVGKARMVKATDLEAFVASLTAGALDGRMV